MEKNTLEMYKDDNDEDGDIYIGDPRKEWDRDEPDEDDDPDEDYNDD